MSAQQVTRPKLGRVRLMLRHTRLIVVAAVLLCAGLGAVSFYLSSLPTQLKIAVGPPGSEDERVVEEIAQQLREERPKFGGNVRLTVVRKDGTLEAAKAIDNGTADLAIVRRDIAMPRDGQAVAVLRKNVVAIWVPAQEPQAKPAPVRRGARAAAAKKPEKIEKIEDLVGKRIGIIGRSQSNVELFKIIVGQYGISADKVVMLSSEDEKKPNAPGKISVVQFSTDKVATTIRESKVDAVMAVGPVSSPITAAALTASKHDKDGPTFLEINASEAIAERNPIYEATEIKAGAFGGAPRLPEEDIETISVNHYIVARKKLSEDTVAEFTRHLFAIRQALSARLPAAAKIETPDTDKDAAVPVHPGAAAYIDDELKTFFDRYNDLLYWGIMLLSFFGSGLAGLMSYTKADDRVRRMKALERLLDVTKAARSAESTQALDELQDETDRILADMLQEVEANTLDQAAVTAFQVLFNQAQMAVADRRAALTGQPARPRPAVAAV